MHFTHEYIFLPMTPVPALPSGAGLKQSLFFGIRRDTTSLLGVGTLANLGGGVYQHGAQGIVIDMDVPSRWLRLPSSCLPPRFIRNLAA